MAKNLSEQKQIAYILVYWKL